MFRFFSRLILILFVPVLSVILIAMQAGAVSGSSLAAFTMAQDSQFDVFMVDTATGRPVKLTKYPLTRAIAHDYFAGWSPDGKYIAVNSGSTGGLDVMEAFGRHRRRISDFCYFHVLWSPDSTRILCAEAGHPLRIMTLADGTTVWLLRGTSTNDRAAWSPDSARIAYVEDSVIRTDPMLVVINADGSGSRPIMSLPALLSEIIWLDNARMAFVERCSGQYSVIIKNVDTLEATCYPVDVPGFGQGWAWSPDKQTLAYASPCGLALMRLIDGKQDCFDIGTINSDLAWSPDGKFIAFSIYRTLVDGGGAAIGHAHAFGIFARGSHEFNRFFEVRDNDIQGFAYIAWSPDGRWLTLAQISSTGGIRPPMLVDMTTGEVRAFLRDRCCSGGGFDAWQPE